MRPPQTVTTYPRAVVTVWGAHFDANPPPFLDPATAIGRGETRRLDALVRGERASADGQRASPHGADRIRSIGHQHDLDSALRRRRLRGARRWAGCGPLRAVPAGRGTPAPGPVDRLRRDPHPARQRTVRPRRLKGTVPPSALDPARAAQPQRATAPGHGGGFVRDARPSAGCAHAWRGRRGSSRPVNRGSRRFRDSGGRPPRPCRPAATSTDGRGTSRIRSWSVPRDGADSGA